MSFTDLIFPDRRPTGPVPRLGAQTTEDHRRRLAREIARGEDARETLDLASRVGELEHDLDQAAVVVEALVELIVERIGISREEIGGRVAEVLATVNDRNQAPDEGPAHARQPPPEAPATPETQKDRFVPRRNWRDARGL